jgi:hypothetical protein
MTAPTLSSLSPARQRLVRLLQQTHFGRVQRLTVRNGQPVFDPPPQVVRTYKFGPTASNEPAPSASAANVLLRQQVVDLLAHLDRLGDGMVERIEVAHGTPVYVEIAEPANV